MPYADSEHNVGGVQAVFGKLRATSETPNPTRASSPFYYRAPYNAHKHTQNYTRALSSYNLSAVSRCLFHMASALACVLSACLAHDRQDKMKCTSTRTPATSPPAARRPQPAATDPTTRDGFSCKLAGARTRIELSTYACELRCAALIAWQSTSDDGGVGGGGGQKHSACRVARARVREWLVP